MKIKDNVLLSVSEADIKNGKFFNSEVTEVAEGCFYDLDSLTSVNLPNVIKIGSGCFCYNQALTELSLNKKKYKVKDVDGYCFVIEHTYSTKGIKIYSGYNLMSIKNQIHNKGKSFVSEKDGFFAHGETCKKSISDLNFKIVAEKLKNEPIEKDTLISVNHYRLITGACEFGVKTWMFQNGITEENIKASDLLPLLEKTQAYGLEKFKSLITF